MMEDGIYDEFLKKMHWGGHPGQWQRCAMTGQYMVFVTQMLPPKCTLLTWRSTCAAHGPGTGGAGTRVCGYAIKNSGLIVEVIRQHLHVCVKELRVKIRSPQG